MNRKDILRGTTNQSIPERPGLLMRWLVWLMPKMTPAHVWLYRQLRGRFVGRATGGAPVLLVTTTGRRSGQPRTVALGYLPDGDDVIVAGTNGGKPTLPAWIYNMQANPEAYVERGGDKFSARVEFLDGEAWQQHWQRLVTAFPVYDQARRFAGRKIPLVRLCREP